MPPAEERHSPLLRCDILKVFRRQPGLSEVAGAGGTKGTSRHETFTQIKVSGHRRTRLTRLIRNLSPGRKGGGKKNAPARRGHRGGSLSVNLQVYAVIEGGFYLIIIMGCHIFSPLWEQSFSRRPPCAKFTVGQRCSLRS